MNESYQSPLVDRYASAEMLRLWSPASRHRLWRELWATLAQSQMELGLAITPAQVAAIRRAVDQPIDYARVAEHEAKTRHDVMAHLHVLGEAAPAAKGILHLGATSCFVTDNADLILMRRALELTARRLEIAMARLANFARAHREMPTLGFTHLQPAQPTTVGKRACLWIQDLLLAHEEVSARARGLRLRGAKGTTGTQDSYLKLFGDSKRVVELDAKIARAFAFDSVYPVTGQTYPRLIDTQVLASLSTIAQASAKMANDIRFLASLKEIEEPIETGQVGSSAMAYKRNPMRCERVSSLARQVFALASSAPATAAAQFLERTLDDSACRRISIPESFLCADAILLLVADISTGLIVNPKVIARRLAAELPFLATEGILMAATAAGGDRQEAHERIRIHSRAASERIKNGDGVNDLTERIAADPAFASVKARLGELCDSRTLVGRSVAQVEAFLDGEAAPVIKAAVAAEAQLEPESIRV